MCQTVAGASFSKAQSSGLIQPTLFTLSQGLNTHVNSLLAELTAQIRKLESQRAQLQEDAEKHRKKAMASVVQELIEQIATYGITPKELG